MLLTIIKGFDNWRTTCCLNRDHAGQVSADPTKRLQFGKGFPHANEASTPTGWIENDIGKRPAHLFGEFKTHGFLALNSVGFLQRRNVEPADLFLAIADDLATVIDQAVDHIGITALQLNLADVDIGRIERAEHGGSHSGLPRIGGHRRAGIAIGWNCQMIKPKFVRHRDSKGKAARLERPGRQPSLILDDDVAGDTAEHGRT